ncbi:hypothetical protein S2M10_22760 [Sphingomonas sp. S2M10]|uniref:hypothetical protein n=1 Tax=Sphingomonas sp. S2M10 TaxID=2705010 RepID=UPI00168EB4B7|nr:hypothetical protein [Sphingomonas sp. S2M10]
MRGNKTLAMLGVIAAAASPLPAGQAFASGGGGGGEALHLVKMEPIAVPIVDSDRVAGTLNFQLVLEVHDAATAEKLTAAMPNLRMAAIASGLEFARLDASALRAVNVADLDKTLTGALKTVSPDVGRVLIVEVGASQN